MNGTPAGVFSIPFGRGSGREISENVVGLRGRKGKKFITAAESPTAHAHLLAPPAHAKPEDLSGITIDCSGDRPYLVEHTKAGHNPKHPITTETQLIWIRLADGREVSVAVQIESVTDDHRIEDLYLAASLTELIDDGEE